MDVQHLPVYPESGLESSNTGHHFFLAVCFYEGEIPTDKAAESRDLCKRAISWAGLRGRTDSARDFSPLAPTATIKATASSPPHHCAALAGSRVASYTPKRGRTVPSSPGALPRPVWCFRSHPGAPSSPHPTLTSFRGSPSHT